MQVDKQQPPRPAVAVLVLTSSTITRLRLSRPWVKVDSAPCMRAWAERSSLAATSGQGASKAGQGAAEDISLQ